MVVYVVQRLRVMSDGKGKSKSEKFPPPHQDGAVGHPLSSAEASFASSIFDPKSASRRKNGNDEPHSAPSRRFISTYFNPSSVARSMDLRFGRR